MKNAIILFLLFFTSCFATAQNSIKFEVRNESGTPLIGATVVIEGTTTGTITSSNGIAQFDNLPDGELEFAISFIGYQDYQMTLRSPQDNNKTIQIELEEEGEEIEEVVIFTTRFKTGGAGKRQ